MDNENTSKDSSGKLEKIPTNKVDAEKVRLIARLENSMFSGPVPPPEALKAYDLVQPGLANELVDMAKKQSQHRMDMEKVVIVGDSQRSWVGLIFGFIITLVSIGTGAFLIQQGHDVAGGVFAGTPIVSIVTAFIYGTNKRSQERIEKHRAMIEAGMDNDDENDE